MSFDFDGNTVNGSVIFFTRHGDSLVPAHFETAMQLFDSYFEDVLVTAIPLKKDLQFKFAEFIYERGGLVWSTGQVLGPCDDKCWSIVYFEKDKGGNTIRTITYKIEPQNRQIISREYKTPNTTMVMRSAK